MTFQPFVDRDALPPLLRTADVLVVPSRWAEPSGLTVGEGLATGLPIIASRVGGIPEVLGSAGILVEPDDAAGLSAALRRLADDPGLRLRLGREGRPAQRSTTGPAHGCGSAVSSEAPSRLAPCSLPTRKWPCPRVRLTLGRAAVQTIADHAGIELLHIKGNAVDAALREPTAIGSDIDILVLPAHVEKLDRELRKHGWRVYSTFTWGSPFGHAQTYTHEIWGYVDVHRWFPGIRADAARAFALLCSGSRMVEFGGTPSRVPGVVDRRRSSCSTRPVAVAMGRTCGACGTTPPPERRREIEKVIDALDARVAFSAATGDLESLPPRENYRLWKVISEGGIAFGRVVGARSSRSDDQVMRCGSSGAHRW